MSGGHWEYKNDSACSEIFDWELNPVYGIGEKSQKRYSAIARQLDPLEDIELSDLVYDVFCLLHSYDWYASGDNCREVFLADAEAFKKKWLKSDRSDRLKGYIDAAVSDLRKKLVVMIGEQEREE